MRRRRAVNRDRIDSAGLHPIARASQRKYPHRMNTKTFRPVRLAGAILCVSLLPLLSGCVAGPSRGSVQMHGTVMLEDDYVYYPGYEVYYSSNRHNYVYRDGRNWVTRPAPPRVSVDVLFASPSVRVDFHDSPAQHHANVVRSYPKNWRPAPEQHEVRKDNQAGEKKNDDNRRRDDKNGDDRKRD